MYKAKLIIDIMNMLLLKTSSICLLYLSLVMPYPFLHLGSFIKWTIKSVVLFLAYSHSHVTTVETSGNETS